VTDQNKPEKNVPPAVLSAPPEREIERKVKADPDDLDAKADLGSDESMDASDPPSAAQTGFNEPVPSSGFPETNDR
jgi:acyl dehydratase